MSHASLASAHTCHGLLICSLLFVVFFFAQYSTNVCLGNPGRSFDLIVDTGSSITAVPCSTCRQCGRHQCGKQAGGCFDAVRSASSTTIKCRQPPAGFSCERCASERCSYSVHYTEGSAISGHVVTDYAFFTRGGDGTRGSGAATDARVFFGCQTSESGMFYKQEADGILGMQPPRARARMPSMLASLVQQKAAAETFSLCLSDRSGLFLLGGRADAAAMRQRGALTVPMQTGARARYTLNLRDVRVSGSGSRNTSFTSLKLPAATFAPTLVDSGTTFVYASTPLYRAIHAHVKQETPSLQREGGKVCAFLSQAQLAAMPSLQLVFNVAASQIMLVKPQQYMVEFPKAAPLLSAGTPRDARHYCVAVFDNQRQGTVIGASIMRQREVIFDIGANSITFADADCNRLTPETSGLKGAYAFAPCPPANSSSTIPAGGGAKAVAAPVSNAKGAGGRNLGRSVSAMHV